MAEFQKVMRQKKRMCNSIPCCECDIHRLCGGDDDFYKCQRFINNDPKKAEEVIMSWAAEHPEPVYPTWAEWLHDNGIILDARQHNETEHWLLGIEAMRPIPADIAEKLGLEPKEDA